MLNDGIIVEKCNLFNTYKQFFDIFICKIMIDK